MKNLNDLSLAAFRPKNHIMFDSRINMYPLGNLKNLKSLSITCNFGVTDEFLINLSKNAKQLEILSVSGTYITDVGLSAINNLEQMKNFDLGLSVLRINKNEFITDESLQCLFNKKLECLNLSDCIKITDKGVIKLVENLPNLSMLVVKNTKVTREGVIKIYHLTKHRQKYLDVFYTVKKCN